MLHWKLKHRRRRLLQHVQDNQPKLQVPMGVWWIIVAALLHVFDSISVTLAIIQARNSVILQQHQEVANLIFGLCINFGICTTADNLMVGVDFAIVVSTDDWWLEKLSIVLHIKDQGSRTCDLFESLYDDDKIRVVKEIGIFVLWIVSNGLKVQAERDHNNIARTIEAPPVMPAELVRCKRVLSSTMSLIRSINIWRNFDRPNKLIKSSLITRICSLPTPANPQSRKFWMLAITKLFSMMCGSMSRPASSPCTNLVADWRLFS